MKAKQRTGSVREYNGKWRARATLADGRRVNLGTHATEAEAREAIRIAAEAPPEVPVLPVGALTLGDYAARLGIPHGTVKRWAHEGMAGLVRGGWRGRVLGVWPDQADAWVAEHHGSSVSFGRSTCVYFARCEKTGLVKIGYTQDLDRRVGELRRLGAAPVVLATMPGNADTEHGLHARFADLRVDGEWFRPEARLLAFVEAVAGTVAA